MTDQKELEQETMDTQENNNPSEVAEDIVETSVENTDSTEDDKNQLTEQPQEDVSSDESEKDQKPSTDGKPQDDKKPQDSKSENLRGGKGKRDRRNRDDRPRRRHDGEKKEFEERMLEVRRVTRVTTWWRQLSFRATVLIWNKNGKIGLWVAKWNDVQSAVSKATHDAYKNIITVTINNNGSVPYPTETKFKSAYIKLIPALPGTGLKAGASVRQVLELAWYTNILSKIVWTNNKLNNAILAIKMLGRFKNFGQRFVIKKESVETEKEKVTSEEITK